MPYRIYPINTRSRRGKEKSICILQLVRRLSLLCIGDTLQLKIRPTCRLLPDPLIRLPGCAAFFFGQVECCPQPFIRFTQRPDHLFYVCCFGLFKPKKLRRPVATFQIFKELSALFAEYICIISRLFLRQVQILIF